MTIFIFKTLKSPKNRLIGESLRFYQSQRKESRPKFKSTNVQNKTRLTQHVNLDCLTIVKKSNRLYNNQIKSNHLFLNQG